jgi:CNT family concentrative nucleoside transporter
LVIRPYLAALTPSQIFTVMSVGMAGVAGTILAAYAGLGVRVDYLVAAAFMSAPGGVFMGKLIMPDTPPLHDAVEGDAALTNPHIKPSWKKRPKNSARPT